MVDYEDVENLLSEDEDDRGFEDLPELIPLLPEDSFSFAEDVSRLHEFLPGDSLGFSGPFLRNHGLSLENLMQKLRLGQAQILMQERATQGQMRLKLTNMTGT